MLHVVTWAGKMLGRHVHAPGGIGGECVDLANLWLLDNGIPLVRRNAVDWAFGGIGGMTWVPNGPVNVPPTGALVVWDHYPALGIGPNGHIAVVLASDPMSLLTLDQNWPDGGNVSFVLHSYKGVLGWNILST